MENDKKLIDKIQDKEKTMYHEFFQTKYKMTVKKRTEFQHQGLDKPTYTDDLLAVEVYETEEAAHLEGQRLCIESFKKREDMIQKNSIYSIGDRDSTEVVEYYYTVEKVHVLR